MGQSNAIVKRFVCVWVCRLEFEKEVYKQVLPQKGTQRGLRSRLFVKENTKKDQISCPHCPPPTPPNPTLQAEWVLYSLLFLLFHFWLYPENKEHNNMAWNGCALLLPGNRILTMMAQRLIASMHVTHYTLHHHTLQETIIKVTFTFKSTDDWKPSCFFGKYIPSTHTHTHTDA